MTGLCRIKANFSLPIALVQPFAANKLQALGTARVRLPHAAQAHPQHRRGCLLKLPYQRPCCIMAEHAAEAVRSLGAQASA
jgi:hypothetical protein